jgi:3-phosphoshikimate 1-carboxyvinyltransferase
VFPSGDISIDARISSQFISSILIGAPYAEHDVSIHLIGEPVSLPYIMMTMDSMRAFGAEVQMHGGGDDGPIFTVSSQKKYKPRRYVIEGDYSSSSYGLHLQQYVEEL